MKSSDASRLRITPEVLLKAYAIGVFPMAESATDPGLFWIEPDQRGLIPLDKFHVPRRLARTIRSGKFEVRIDTDFDGVIAGCAKPAPGRRKTWINDRIRDLYSDLFALGHCHTVETWHDGELVGGLYGIALSGSFFGESMFSTERDASKIALVYLVARLKYGGFTLLDIQFLTDHLQSFGAFEVERDDYQERLTVALSESADFHRMAGGGTSDEVLQLVSQTS
jgi:leucyl/phenylalanyl-tRNA--protein transferase